MLVVGLALFILGFVTGSYSPLLRSTGAINPVETFSRYEDNKAIEEILEQIDRGFQEVTEALKNISAEKTSAPSKQPLVCPIIPSVASVLYDENNYRYDRFGICKPDKTGEQCECGRIYFTGPNAGKRFWINEDNGIMRPYTGR